jgi:DNA-directed RNA polymerase specialized sigma24 family protein
MDDVFSTARPLLFSIAYRMLGSASDAEDVLQDAWPMRCEDRRYRAAVLAVVYSISRRPSIAARRSIV